MKEVGSFPFSPEEGNRSTFRNVVLELSSRIPDDGHSK
jgi:hypothetical protein